MTKVEVLKMIAALTVLDILFQVTLSLIQVLREGSAESLDIENIREYR